ncbi:MAG: DUF2764 family protein [Candidatus Omnitrophica bacterium]|jgi:hypothetical protein|nr:DUF2764 family protein [Candidatus Omnitrophota bacterium]
MDKYYYFASQLPLLIFGKKVHIDRGYFLEEAEKWLSEKDLKVLLEANINYLEVEKVTNKYLKEYLEFERSLRKELAEVRSSVAASGVKNLAILKLWDWNQTPLEIEKNLLFLRWQFIEGKEEGHYFDIEFLIYYFLKLQILEMLFAFDKEKGTVIFDRLCEVKL